MAHTPRLHPTGKACILTPAHQTSCGPTRTTLRRAMIPQAPSLPTALIKSNSPPGTGRKTTWAWPAQIASTRPQKHRLLRAPHTVEKLARSFPRSRPSPVCPAREQQRAPARPTHMTPCFGTIRRQALKSIIIAAASMRARTTRRLR